MGLPRFPVPCTACGNLTSGASWCDTCRPAHERARNDRKNQKGAPYRTTAWQRARSAALARDYFLCVVCGDPTRANLTVHHIDHDNTNHRADNLATLCRRHHGQLEAEAQAGRTTGPVHRELGAYLRAREAARRGQ